MRSKLAVTALAMVFAMAPLADAKVAPAQQTETGTILLPMPHPQDPTICFQGAQRRLNMISQGVASGQFGVVFDIDKKTWGGKFTLEVTRGTTNAEDLDIYFFQSFGGQPPEDPIYNSPTIVGEYTEEEVGGETGVVTPTAVKAIVCMKGGFVTDFEYEAQAPKAKKGKKKR